MFNRLKQKFQRSLTSPGLNRPLSLLWPAGRRADDPVEITKARVILVLKPDGIGDVILVTGFLRTLRRQCPQAHITVAVRGMAKELVSYPAFCDEVMVWKDDWCGMTVPPKSAWDLIRSARTKWRDRRPDWVLIPRSGWDHANASLYAWWTGAANICAHEFFCDDRGMHRRKFVNHLIPTPGMAHETEFHRRMLEGLRLEGNVTPQLELSAAARRRASDLILPGVSGGKRIALGIGASHDSKRWPAVNFKKLVQSIHQKWPDATVFLIGGREDISLAAAIRAGASGGIQDMTGLLAILETAALLTQCHAYVGNNSGPIHLAAASGCAVIEISKHPAGADNRHECSPVRFGPVAEWSSVLQPRALALECLAGCEKAEAHCITGISVEQVMEALTGAFATARARTKIEDAPVNVRFQTTG